MNCVNCMCPHEILIYSLRKTSLASHTKPNDSYYQFKLFQSNSGHNEAIKSLTIAGDVYSLFITIPENLGSVLVVYFCLCQYCDPVKLTLAYIINILYLINIIISVKKLTRSLLFIVGIDIFYQRQVWPKLPCVY